MPNSEVMRTRTVLLAKVVAAVIGLQGCGGGGGGGVASPGLRPEPSPAVVSGGGLPSSYRGTQPGQGDAVYYTVNGIGAPGAYRHPGGNAVRIGIQDDAVDFTHSAFRRRIGLDGASFSYRRPRITRGTDTDAFDNCKSFAPCRVYLVDSGGDRSRMEALARTVLQEQGLPPDNDKWFIYDVSPNGFGWSELPALGLSSSTDPSADAQHGTGVASVAVQQAPDAVIVAMATNFDEQLSVEITLTINGVQTTLVVQDDPYLEDSFLELAGRSLTRSEIDDTLSGAIRRSYESVDIVNSSFSTDVNISTTGGTTKRDAHLARMRELNTQFPKRWEAYTQSYRHEDVRTIRVLAAGNERDTDGNGARSLEALEVYHFPELRGHTVVATALNSSETALASYANACGALPTDWDASKHGRHYCLAAPGTHSVAVPGGVLRVAAGTSYSTAYVSGVLARMMAQFRGQVGNTGLVKRMMDTADNTGVFSDAALYGAGAVDPDAALEPIGTQMTGTRRNQASLRSTSLRMPAAYGDAARRVEGAEIASFDAWNFPFWTPAGALIEDGTHETSPIPIFADPHDSAACFMTNGFAPETACVPVQPASAGISSLRARDGKLFARPRLGTASGTVAGLVAADGAGASMRLSQGVTVAGFTRSAGRLDGRATGAFSFAGGSSLGAVHVARSRAMDDEGRWRFDGRLTVVFDSPHGIGRPEESMFEAGPALLSSWTLGLARTGDDTRTRLSLSQPPRAESGTGRLTYPIGRRLDGTHVHETRAFSLRPSRRTVTAGLVHRRPFAGGEAIVSVHRTENPGHAAGAAEHGGGIAWRLDF